MKIKQNLRKKFALTRNDIAYKSGIDCINVEDFSNLINVLKKHNFGLKNIAIYYPINNEISPLKLIQISKKNEFDLCLPSICSKKRILTFRKWDGKENLKLSFLKTFEPSLSSEIIEPDIMFVPLLAYDKELNRLGYGGGYYDSTIFHLRKKNDRKISFLAIGIGYDKQFINNLPTEKHDQKMDIIFTEKKIIFKKGFFT